MAIAPLINRAVWLCGVLWVSCEGFAAQPAGAPDPRNFANGWKIPVESYCDQPRIVVTKDGTWVFPDTPYTSAFTFPANTNLPGITGAQAPMDYDVRFIVRDASGQTTMTGFTTVRVRGLEPPPPPP